MMGNNFNLKFSTNFNNKLNSYSFLDIRLTGPNHQVGTLFDVYLGTDFLGVAIVNAVKKTKIDGITVQDALLCTGYGSDTTKFMLRRMFKNILSVDTERCDWSVLTLSWQGEPPTTEKVPKRKKQDNHPLNQ